MWTGIVDAHYSWKTQNLTVFYLVSPPVTKQSWLLIHVTHPANVSLHNAPVVPLNSIRDASRTKCQCSVLCVPFNCAIATFLSIFLIEVRVLPEGDPELGLGLISDDSADACGADLPLPDALVLLKPIGWRFELYFLIELWQDTQLTLNSNTFGSKQEFLQQCSEFCKDVAKWTTGKNSSLTKRILR